MGVDLLWCKTIYHWVYNHLPLKRSSVFILGVFDESIQFYSKCLGMSRHLQWMHLGYLLASQPP